MASSKNAAIHGASSSTTRVILVSYGLVGLALFGLLLFVIFGRARRWPASRIWGR